MMPLIRTVIVITLILACQSAGWANVKPAEIFASSAVLQRQMPIPVWGKADPGEKVTVTLADETQSTTADANGRWMVKLSAREAGGPFTLTIQGNNKLTFDDILIGEVWLCSGQSNMAWVLKSTTGAAAEIASANHPKIRQFLATRHRSDSPQETVRGAWAVCSPTTAPGFSAVAYYFGKDLSKELDVPVGLINSSVGGTQIEAWMSHEALKSDPDFKPVFDRYDQAIQNFLTNKNAKAQSPANTDTPSTPATNPAQTQPRAGRPPTDPRISSNGPAVLYNGMIHPFVPYAIRGAIWYQGESNSARPTEYRKLLTTLITDWRKTWGQGDFPFLIVQLANYKPNNNWVEIWEAQTQTWKTVPNTGMAVTIDIGMTGNIHPVNKKDVGERLARFTKALAYGKDIVASGPLFDGMTIQGNKAILTFKHVGSGLTVKGDKPLALFEIAGEDRVYAPATAEIVGETVVVHSDKVPTPVAVRFAWNASAPGFNFYNKEGLPAVSFRTEEKPPAK